MYQERSANSRFLYDLQDSPGNGKPPKPAGCQVVAKQVPGVMSRRLLRRMRVREGATRTFACRRGGIHAAPSVEAVEAAAFEAENRKRLRRAHRRVRQADALAGRAGGALGAHCRFWRAPGALSGSGSEDGRSARVPEPDARRPRVEAGDMELNPASRRVEILDYQLGVGHRLPSCRTKPGGPTAPEGGIGRDPSRSVGEFFESGDEGSAGP